MMSPESLLSLAVCHDSSLGGREGVGKTVTLLLQTLDFGLVIVGEIVSALFILCIRFRHLPLYE
jgi:hypothetical protein